MVLPELIELSRDESGSVRLAAFETLVNMLDMFDTGNSACTSIFISERQFSIASKGQRLLATFLSSLECYEYLMSCVLLVLLCASCFSFFSSEHNWHVEAEEFGLGSSP